MSEESYIYILIQVFISRSTTKHSKRLEKKHLNYPPLIGQKIFLLYELKVKVYIYKGRFSGGPHEGTAATLFP